MKKILSILLTVIMLLSLAACGDASGDRSGSLTTSVLPGENLDTLNAIHDAKFGFTQRQLMANVFAQELENSKHEKFIAIVKIADDQSDDFWALDLWDDNFEQKCLELIGDNPVEEILVASDVLPSKDQLDLYKGTTIAELEAEGAWMSGYAGEKGKYSFNFSGSVCDYRVELEKGTKLEDYDDMDMFDAAIQDMKIGSIECMGLSSEFMDNYMSQFLDAPDPVIPQELGESKLSLDEINAAVGCSIKAVPGATEEKFSVIDGKIAQYIYVLDNTYYCVRSSADTNINLSDDQFGDDPIVDEDGYVTIAGLTTDAINSIRFVFNNYQYAFIIYDNGEFGWDKVDELQNEYRGLICAYPAGSVFDGLIGQYVADDNYSMSISPVSDKAAQVTIFTYTQTETDIEQKLWTMIVRSSGSKLTYDKSKLDVYKNDGQTSQEAGGGSIAVKDSLLVWENHTFAIAGK